MMRLRYRRAALPAVCAALVTMLALNGAQADSRYRFLIFPFEGDIVRRVGADPEGLYDDSPTHEQMFTPLFSAAARCDTYDAEEFPPIVAARLEGSISREDVEYKKLSPEIALRILHALSYRPDNTYDAALWVVCSEGAQVEAEDEDAAPERLWNLEVHLVDRLSSWQTSRVFTTDDPLVYESMTRYAIETLRQMREEGHVETGSAVSAAGGASGQGGTEPGDPGGAQADAGAEGGSDVVPTGPGNAVAVQGENDTRAFEALTQADELERLGQLTDALDALVAVYNEGGLSPNTEFNVACAVARLRIHTGDRESAIEDIAVARKCATEPWQHDRLDRLELLASVSGLNSTDINVHTGRTIEDLKLWLTGNPDDEEARVALAEKYMVLQPEPNWQRAYEEFDKVFYSHPWEPRVRSGMCRCLIRIGRAQKAADYLLEWRTARPETFDDACAELLIEAQRRALGPKGAYAEVLEFLLAHEGGVEFSPEVLQGIAEAIDTELVSKSTRFSAALTDTLTLLTEGPAGVTRTREELRSEVTALDAEFTDLGGALYAMAPTRGYETWLTQLQRSTDFFLQAIAETKYALDASSTQACYRAAEAQRLAAAEGQIGIDSLPAAGVGGAHEDEVDRPL